MDDNSQRDSEVLSRSYFEAQHGQEQRPCAGYQNLECHSMHGSISPHLAKIDDEISSAYQRLSDHVMGRQQIMAEPCHDSIIIHRMPVEIISMIFVFVREAIFDFKFKEHLDHVIPEPPYKQPSQSPPLLVGTVCKRWRDITLATPQLWTDIIIELDKCADGQSNMVKKWARRSGVLPLDITVFLKQGYFDEEADEYEDMDDVISALSSLAVRWNDIALSVPRFFCYELLRSLEVGPPVNSVFLSSLYGKSYPLEVQHPLRPRCLISDYYWREIPFELDRLVYFKTDDADYDDLLHIIHHAQNLRHCIASVDELVESEIPTSPITNHSLIYLQTTCHIIGHLTLPSLRHLDYAIGPPEESVDSIVEFVDRSRPSLDNFILRGYVDQHSAGTLSLFERLPGITSFFLVIKATRNAPDPPIIDDFLLALTRPSANPILPRLQELSLNLPDFSTASWPMVACLFENVTQTDPGDLESNSGPSIGIRRPLSRLEIRLKNSHQVKMNKETFLHLLEVKKSGADLFLTDHSRGDLLGYMARAYGIEL